MVERVDGLPDGVLGYRLWGTVTREEYDAHVLPPLEAAIAAGGPIRCFAQIGPDFEGLTAGAVWEDVKESLPALGSYPRWEKIAAVTDVGWIVRTAGLLGWMAPGELKTFSLAQRDEAIAWIGA